MIVPDTLPTHEQLHCFRSNSVGFPTHTQTDGSCSANVPSQKTS